MAYTEPLVWERILELPIRTLPLATSIALPIDSLANGTEQTTFGELLTWLNQYHAKTDLSNTAMTAAQVSAFMAKIGAMDTAMNNLSATLTNEQKTVIKTKLGITSGGVASGSGNAITAVLQNIMFAQNGLSPVPIRNSYFVLNPQLNTTYEKLLDELYTEENPATVEVVRQYQNSEYPIINASTSTPKIVIATIPEGEDVSEWIENTKFFIYHKQLNLDQVNYDSKAWYPYESGKYRNFVELTVASVLAGTTTLQITYKEDDINGILDQDNLGDYYVSLAPQTAVAMGTDGSVSVPQIIKPQNLILTNDNKIIFSDKFADQNSGTVGDNWNQSGGGLSTSYGGFYVTGANSPGTGLIWRNRENYLEEMFPMLITFRAYGAAIGAQNNWQAQTEVSLFTSGNSSDGLRFSLYPIQYFGNQGLVTIYNNSAVVGTYPTPNTNNSGGGGNYSDIIVKALLTKNSVSIKSWRAIDKEPADWGKIFELDFVPSGNYTYSRVWATGNNGPSVACIKKLFIEESQSSGNILLHKLLNQSGNKVIARLNTYAHKELGCGFVAS